MLHEYSTAAVFNIPERHQEGEEREGEEAECLREMIMPDREREDSDIQCVRERIVTERERERIATDRE